MVNVDNKNNFISEILAFLSKKDGSSVIDNFDYLSDQDEDYLKELHAVIILLSKL
jgi:hypothetical protein